MSETPHHDHEVFCLPESEDKVTNLKRKKANNMDGKRILTEASKIHVKR